MASLENPRNRQVLRKLISMSCDLLDNAVVGAGNAAPSNGSLVGVIFHALCERSAQPGSSTLAPNLAVPVPVFRAFVEQMLELGFMVVSPGQIDAGLDPAGRHLAITFDDGYFNNSLALQVLEEFRVPASFFVSSGHVQSGRAFWWDALSRELSRNAADGPELRAEIERLKGLGNGEAERFLCERFGASFLKPCGDQDRPFTPSELAQFAASPWVNLGNHTRDHAILTNCTQQEGLKQILACQQALEDMSGQRPVAIAYPNGNTSQAVVETAVQAGLRVGFTVRPHRTPVPLTSEARMSIGRFFFHGEKDVRRQCRMFAAPFVPSLALKSLVHRAS
jgi:peptidoglycan/xylan/chitin deacetylase (PgdA/CDA1 family)